MLLEKAGLWPAQLHQPRNIAWFAPNQVLDVCSCGAEELFPTLHNPQGILSLEMRQKGAV